MCVVLCCMCVVLYVCCVVCVLCCVVLYVCCVCCGVAWCSVCRQAQRAHCAVAHAHEDQVLIAARTISDPLGSKFLSLAAKAIGDKIESRPIPPIPIETPCAGTPGREGGRVFWGVA